MKYEIRDLIPIVRELSELYTGKTSTSITYEIAQQLMQSIIYCIDELNDESFMALYSAKISAREAYQIGYQTVLKKTERARQIYNKIAVRFNSYGNKAYETSFINDIPNFFKWYDPRFKAHDHIVFLDYPVLVPFENKQGVDRILTYLEAINIEQQFLQPFTIPYVQEIHWESYCRYDEEVINICRLPLRRILKCLVKEIYSDDIENVDRKKIECCLSVLIERQYHSQQAILEYLSYDLKDYFFELELLREKEIYGKRI